MECTCPVHLAFFSGVLGSFEGQGKTHTRRSPDQRETHLKVGKLAFNFAGSSHSSSVPNN